MKRLVVVVALAEGDLMRVLSMIAVLAACKGSGDAAKQPPPAPPPPAPLLQPSDAVLPLAKVPAPGRVVWLDRSGALSYARAAAPWNGVLPVQRTPIASAEALGELIEREEAELEAKISSDTPSDPLSGGVLFGMSIDPSLALAPGRVPAALGRRDSDVEALLVVAPPEVATAAVIDVLDQLGGRPVVALPGERLGALRFQFRAPGMDIVDDSPGASWVELHLGAAGIDVLKLPANDKRHIAWGTTTSHDLEPFMVQGWDDPDRLDVLVAAGVPYQRLVDLLVILDDLGVITVGVGPSPGPVDGRRAQVLELHNAGGAYRSATAILSLEPPAVVGEIAKRKIGDAIMPQLAAITACYDAQLPKQPALRGTATVQFFITAKGTVASSAGAGLDPDVASCIAAVIKKTAFPAATSGGGTQVRYPFTFRPVEK